MGNRIIGLYINRPSDSGVGLFGSTTTTANIRNIKLVDADVTARQNAGILVSINNGRISNASSTGKITGTVGSGDSDGYYIGGLVGQNVNPDPSQRAANIDRSSSAANVTGTQGVGGLVGYMDNGASINNSSASGTVTAIKQRNNPLIWFGGLLGVNIRSTVSNSYAEGEVNAAEMVRAGGLVGENGGTISRSYALGKVTGRSTVGGLTGILSLENGNIENSYAAGSVNAVGDGAVQVGGLIGYVQEKTKVSNSYAGGPVNISGNNPVHVGGLIGYMQGESEVSNSYASGAMNVTGSNPQAIGGLIGTIEEKTKVVSSYWNTDSIANGGTGIGPGSDARLGIGKTGKELMATGTFANSGWDISNVGSSTAVWRIYDGVTMPLLRNFMQDLDLTLPGGSLTPNVTFDGATRFGPSPNAPSRPFTAATGRNAGTYSPSSTQQGYNITGGNLKILPAELTVSTENVTKLYDGTTSAVGAGRQVIKGTLYAGDRLSGGTFEFTDPNVNAEGGNKTVTVRDVRVTDGNNGNNYALTLQDNTTSTINPRPLTVSTGNVAKTYDGTADAPGAAAAIVEGRLYAGDSLNGGAFAFADRNAGTGNKTVTVRGITVNDGNGGNNYLLKLSPNMSSTISPAPLTVTANGDRKAYDAVPYKGGNGVAIAGFAGGETADVLGGQLGYGGNAQGALLPGSYRITPAGLQSQNYAISYASGTLQIDQPPDLTSRDNLLNPMQPAGPQRVLSIGGATVQVAGCGISLPANVLGVDCIAASAKDGR